MRFFLDLLCAKDTKRKEIWTQHAKSISSNFLVIGYDSLSQLNFPICDKVSLSHIEAYQRNVRSINNCEYIVDIIQIIEEK